MGLRNSFRDEVQQISGTGLPSVIDTFMVACDFSGGTAAPFGAFGGSGLHTPEHGEAIGPGSCYYRPEQIRD